MNNSCELIDSPVGRIPMSWEALKISDSDVDILDGDRGNEYPKENDFMSSGFCLFLSAKNVTKNGFKFKECAFISEEKDGKLKKGRLVKGDIVITTRGTVGNMAYYDEFIPYEIVRINSGMAVLRNDDDLISTKFLYQLLKAPTITQQIDLLTFGSAQPQLTIGIINSLCMPVPPLPEQQKIASILTSVDTVIEKTEAQISKLKDLKQAMTQELLTQGIGHTEFKDSPVGRIPKEWGVVKFVEISKSITCGVASTPKYVSEAEGIPFLSAQNVANGQVVLDKYQFIGKDFHQKLTKNTKPEQNDILYSRVGAKYGEAGVIDFNWDFSIYVSLTLIKLKDICNPYFYKYFLNSIICKQQAKNGVFAGAGVPNLNVAIVKDFVMILPPKEEQEQIANILLSIDKRIDAKEKKLSHTKSLKKALMQDLLTGKVRVSLN
jgi:type I restriction enzyme, S subunit